MTARYIVRIYHATGKTEERDNSFKRFADAACFASGWNTSNATRLLAKRNADKLRDLSIAVAIDLEEGC